MHPGPKHTRDNVTNEHSLLSLRRVRLASGIVMFVYLTQHLINHALGLVSLDLAERGLRVALLVWRNPAATILLYCAAATHFLLALWTLYYRREWHFPVIEIVRLATAFSFPMLLIGHAVTTRLGDALYNLHPSYALIVSNLAAQGNEGTQLAMLAPGWVHGCLGLWISLRRVVIMQRLKWLLIALMVLLPLAAAFGFLAMVREVATLPPTPAPSSQTLAAQASLSGWRDVMRNSYLWLIAAAFAAGRLRAFLLHRTHLPHRPTKP